MPHGIFNVKKCVAYLRSVGVEINDRMASDWDLAERATRFARSMKSRKREGWECYCKNGHMTYREWRRGARRHKPSMGKCDECGEYLTSRHLRFVELRDGTIKDYRDKEERWKPLDDPRQT